MCTYQNYWNKVNLTKSKSKKNKKIDSIGIGLASPEEIRRWGERRLPNGTLLGQVEKDHTVDYESLKPIEGGLFCERIFGPVEDFYCSCERRGEKNEKFCPICEVEFTKSRVRRTRMGYIPLAVPVAHVWYLRGRPSYIANLIGKSRTAVDRLAYGETLCESFIGHTDSTYSNFFQHTDINLVQQVPVLPAVLPSAASLPTDAKIVWNKKQKVTPAAAIQRKQADLASYLKEASKGSVKQEIAPLVHNLSSFYSEGKQNSTSFIRQVGIISSFSQNFAQTTTNGKTSFFCEFYSSNTFLDQKTRKGLPANLLLPKLQGFPMACFSSVASNTSKIVLKNFISFSTVPQVAKLNNLKISHSPIKNTRKNYFVQPCFAERKRACFSSMNPVLKNGSFILTNSIQNARSWHTNLCGTPKRVLRFTVVAPDTAYQDYSFASYLRLAKQPFASCFTLPLLAKQKVEKEVRSCNVKVQQALHTSLPPCFFICGCYSWKPRLLVTKHKVTSSIVCALPYLLLRARRKNRRLTVLPIPLPKVSKASGLRKMVCKYLSTTTAGTITPSTVRKKASGLASFGQQGALVLPSVETAAGKIAPGYIKTPNKVNEENIVGCEKKSTLGKYNKFHSLPLFSTFVYKEWSHRFYFLEYFIWSARSDDVTIPFYVHQEKGNSSNIAHTIRKNYLNFVKNKILSRSASFSSYSAAPPIINATTLALSSLRYVQQNRQSITPPALLPTDAKGTVSNDCDGNNGLVVCDNDSNDGNETVRCTFFHPKRGFFVNQKRSEKNFTSFLRISSKERVEQTTSFLSHKSQNRYSLHIATLHTRAPFFGCFGSNGNEVKGYFVSKSSVKQALVLPEVLPSAASQAKVAKQKDAFTEAERAPWCPKEASPKASCFTIVTKDAGSKASLPEASVGAGWQENKSKIRSVAVVNSINEVKKESLEERRSQQNKEWGKIDDTQQFPRLAELLSFTGGTALRYLLSRFDLILLGKFLRYELKNLEFKVNSLLALKILTYSQGLLLGKLAKRRSKQIRRLKLLELFQFQKSNPEWMILSVLPVLPPDLRPILRVNDDFVVASDLNRLYQTVLRRNNTIRERLDDPLPCPESGLFRQRSLQKAVDGLLENGKGGGTPLCASKRRPLVSLSHVLKGKKGLFRQHLLGKRVDYSGRSVIVVGPKLNLHECGLPKEMAMELFQPFLLKRLKVKGLAYSNTVARQMIQQEDPVIWHILKQLVYEHPILLNRAPTLHRLGIQAFQPRLVSGRAILLHPLVCNGFNADFDGDQMAVHIPLSFQARAEAWKILWSKNNFLSPATGQPILMPSQDMVLGCYYLSVSVPRVLGFINEVDRFLTPSSTVGSVKQEVATFKNLSTLPTSTFCFATFASVGSKAAEGRTAGTINPLNSTIRHSINYVSCETNVTPIVDEINKTRNLFIYHQQPSYRRLPACSASLGLRIRRGKQDNDKTVAGFINEVNRDRNKVSRFINKVDRMTRSVRYSKDQCLRDFDVFNVAKRRSWQKETNYNPKVLCFAINPRRILMHGKFSREAHLPASFGITEAKGSGALASLLRKPFDSLPLLAKQPKEEPQEANKSNEYAATFASVGSEAAEGRTATSGRRSKPLASVRVDRRSKLFSLFGKISLFRYTRNAKIVTQLLLFPKKRFASFSFFTSVNLEGVPFLALTLRPKVVIAFHYYHFDTFLPKLQIKYLSSKVDDKWYKTIQESQEQEKYSFTCFTTPKEKIVSNSFSYSNKIKEKNKTNLIHFNKEHYFSNLQDSLLAYFQGRLQTHTPFWVRVDIFVQNQTLRTKDNLDYSEKVEETENLVELIPALPLVTPKVTFEAGHPNFSTKSTNDVEKSIDLESTFVEISSFEDRPKNNTVEYQLGPIFQPRYGSSQKVCNNLFQNSRLAKRGALKGQNSNITNVIVESNDTLEAPLELRLSVNGNLVKISPTFQNHYSYNATVLDQCNEKSIRYMRTTAGRVVINKTLF